MKEHRPLASPIRFGVYEVDLISEELRKGGLKIRLSGQPFQVLALLLERPGEVITREELQKKLWPDGTFVDFDHSLNTAINKIREALGDSAENPRLVETLARRGYRFIAPVEKIRTESTSSSGPSVSSIDGKDTHHGSGRSASAPQLSAPEEHLARPAAPEPLQVKSRKRRRVAVAFLLVLAAVMGAVAMTWRLSRPSTQPTLNIIRLTSDSGLTTDGVISSDGRLVAYASDRSGDGNLDIWVKQVPKGEPIRRTSNFADDHEPAFSPDGSQIVFRSEREAGGLYLIPTLAGEERLLTQFGRNPRFSPDGNWIAYWTGEIAGQPLGAQAGAGALYVVSSAGGSPVKVQMQAGFISAGSPIWSPDGKYLLFYGNRANRFPIGSTGSDWWVVPNKGGDAIKTGAFDVFDKHQIATGLSFAPLPTEWRESRILFSAKHGDSVNLWQAAISPETWQLKNPRRLTTGSALETRPSAARDGTLVFSSMAENGDIWSLPLAAEQGKVTGALKQLTQQGTVEYQPSISADGKVLVFVSERSGNHNIWMKDLESGKETPLTRTPAPRWANHPEISPDGTWVCYHESGSIQVVSTLGGDVRRVCDNCGVPWDWTPDGKRLSFNRSRGGPGENPTDKRTVHLWDLASGKETLLLEHATSSLFQANFSPDFRWISFVVAPPGCRVFIAPFRGDAAIPQKDWFALGDGPSWDDKPRWSPDGNLLYFVSDRDGFICLWAQRLDPITKRPREAPFAIYDFHNARRSMRNVGYGVLEISVARDKVVFNLGELTGNLWMTKLDLK